MNPNVLTAIAYFAIPLTVAWIIFHCDRVLRHSKSMLILGGTAAFILACGIGHALMWPLWDWVTATVSCSFAVYFASTARSLANWTNEQIWLWQYYQAIDKLKIVGATAFRPVINADGKPDFICTWNNAYGYQATEGRLRAGVVLGEALPGHHDPLFENGSTLIDRYYEAFCQPGITDTIIPYHHELKATYFYNRATRLDGDRLFMVYVDITEIETLRQKVVARNRDLERLVAEQLSILKTATHDLKTPLSTISTFTGRILARESGLSDRAWDWIQRCNQAAIRGAELTTALLQFGRIDPLSQPDQVRPCQVDRVLQQALNDLGPGLHQELVIDELPDNCIVNFNELELRMVFTNLLENSYKYRHRDRLPVVRVWCSQTGSPHRICIRDNGRGINPDELSKIWEMGHRGSNAMGEYGTGIGLATVRKIITKYGGQIWADSDGHTGTTITIEIP